MSATRGRRRARCRRDRRSSMAQADPRGDVPPASQRPRRDRRRGGLDPERRRRPRAGSPSIAALTAPATAAAPANAPGVMGEEAPARPRRRGRRAADRGRRCRPARCASLRRSWCPRGRSGRRGTRRGTRRARRGSMVRAGRASRVRRASCSQVEAAASRRGSIEPPGPSAPASSNACSVSSRDPAARPAAIGWSAGPGGNRHSRRRAPGSAADSNCVGMPRASPSARPGRAPSRIRRPRSPTAHASIRRAPRRRGDLDQRPVERHRVERALVVGLRQPGAGVSARRRSAGVGRGQRRREHAAVGRDAGDDESLGAVGRRSERRHPTCRTSARHDGGIARGNSAIRSYSGSSSGSSANGQSW